MTLGVQEKDEFGLEQGNKIRKAKLFCVPVRKTVTEATVDREPIDLVPIFQNDQLTDADRICYKIKSGLILFVALLLGTSIWMIQRRLRFRT